MNITKSFIQELEENTQFPLGVVELSIAKDILERMEIAIRTECECEEIQQKKLEKI